MLRCITRSYWYKGLKGYHLFKKEYLKKAARWPKENIHDPLSEKPAFGNSENLDGKKEPIYKYVEYLLKKPGVSLAGHALAYLAYHASKHDITDSTFWEEIEMQTIKALPNLNPRMLHGCMFGIVRSNTGDLLTVESLLREYQARGLDCAEAYDCFEMAETAVKNTRTDYDFRSYYIENFVPRLVGQWNKARFLHIDSYWLRLCTAFKSMEYYEPEIWYKILDIVNRKKLTHFPKWKKVYDMLLSLKDSNFEKESEISLDSYLEKMRQVWESSGEFQWLYNLQENRLYTPTELIEAAKDTPSEINWKEGEEYIRHNLPRWYKEADIEVDEDIKDLFEEYQQLKSLMR